jgi:hypothetical protein
MTNIVQKDQIYKKQRDVKFNGRTVDKFRKSDRIYFSFAEYTAMTRLNFVTE